MKKHFLLLLCLIGTLNACKKETDLSYSLKPGSLASWKGYLENGYFNSGTIEVLGSDFTIQDENISSGQISMPLSSILITNQLSAEEKIQLTHHLQSADFFNMALNPNVIYKVNEAKKMTSSDVNGNNYMIKGEMTILGKTLPLDIPAKVQLFQTSFNITATFKFDRTKWGMLYASDNGLSSDMKIKNEIEVTLNLELSR